MENTDIKKECEMLYAIISDSNSRLKELRELCKHEETFEGKYSYGPGIISPATICEFCNKVVKPVYE